MALFAIAGAALLIVQMVTHMPVPVKPHEIIDLSSGDAVSREVMSQSLARHRVVLVGEQHDDPGQHLVQLRVIQSLHESGAKVAVGMEQFPRDLQPVLSRWSEGHMSEEAFLDATQWYNIWGMDAELYLPILRYLRDHKIPLLGINVRRSTISQVRKQGLANLHADLKAKLPTPAPAPADYRMKLEGIFDGHLSRMGMGGKTENFIEAQRMWDAVMADGLHRWLMENPDGIAIGLAGTGHVEHGHGIAHQLKARGVNDVAMVIPWSEENEWIEQEMGDYAWGTPTKPVTMPKVKLGIYLDDGGDVPIGSVNIVKVMHGSVALKMGLQKDDRILALNGELTRNNHQLIRLLRNSRWGDEIELRVKRDGKSQTIRYTLPDTPPKSPHHGAHHPKVHKK
uniref:PDZ domain-containing protein n=1 Tax=Magnetococcus massalia (strain MO-1) TaxID=451514 RepID=A0A1S7LH74_MAGMO|nr:Conserved protein of unknown function [Candidatus Magnetococcus massalia]